MEKNKAKMSMLEFIQQQQQKKNKVILEGSNSVWRIFEFSH
jgi:hypothetical protein